MVKFDELSQLPVLLYHRVVNDKKEHGKHRIYIYRKQFEKQLQFLAKNGYKTLKFSDLEYYHSMDPRTPKVILTFDDGYIDNYNIVFPLLKKYNFTAVIFLVSRLKKNEWGIAEGEPAFDLLTDEQIIEMSEYGIEFGSHTQTHRDLLRLDPEDAREEIDGSKKDIEKLTGIPIVSFAYPFGGLNDIIKEFVGVSGYRYGVSTNTGPYDFHEDPMQVRRIEVSKKTSIGAFKWKVSGKYFIGFSIWSFLTSK
jgi:peptidoglycan/xylan/chitin deacetylase (PgdA/CDA1 family)